MLIKYTNDNNVQYTIQKTKSLTKTNWTDVLATIWQSRVQFVLPRGRGWKYFALNHKIWHQIPDLNLANFGKRMGTYNVFWSQT